MNTSTKQVLLTTFIIITVLFGFSSIVASQTVATPINVNSITYYSPGTFQKSIIGKMITNFNPNLSIGEKEIIVTAIIAESQKINFDPLLVASIIAAESSFRPRAISACEARGLMQITDCVSKIMKISNPFDIRQNIYAGTRYLKDLYHQFERFELILAAYNSGPTRVARLGRVPRITETVNYIQRVSGFYQNIRNQLLVTVNTIISHPVFDPISATFDHSQTPVIAVGITDQTPLGPLTVENDWSEPELSSRFLIKA